MAVTYETKTKIPEKIQKSIGAVLDLLKSGKLPQVIAKITFPKDSKPMSAWSMSNQLICVSDWIITNYPEIMKLETPEERGEAMMSHVSEAFEKADYRGFAQWNEAKRKIIKGQSSTATIIAPKIAKFNERYYEQDGKKIVLGKNEKAPKGANVKNQRVSRPVGFFGINVFEIKQTKGQKIIYKKLKLPQLPFMPVAKFLGLSVVPQAFRGSYYGYYSPSHKTIVLATPDQVTFFHELSHAVDDYLLKQSTGKGLKGGQQADQEIVAQFSANVIAYIRGYKIEETTAYTRNYIKHYSETDEPEKEIILLIARVEKIVDFITNFKEAKSPKRQEEEKQGEPKDKTEELADNPPKPKPAVTDQEIIDKFGLKGKKAEAVKNGEPAK